MNAIWNYVVCDLDKLVLSCATARKAGFGSDVLPNLLQDGISCVSDYLENTNDSHKTENDLKISQDLLQQKQSCHCMQCMNEVASQ